MLTAQAGCFQLRRLADSGAITAAVSPVLAERRLPSLRRADSVSAVWGLWTECRGERGTGADVPKVNADASTSYSIDIDNRLVTVTYVGVVDPHHLMKRQAELRMDPDFDPSFGLLVDALQADLSAFSAELLRRLAAGTPFNPDARRAFLVTEGLNHAIMRMFQAFGDTSGHAAEGLNIFRDRASALRWLASDKG